mmetsp:Transcript_18866/g.39697  ORF Transcript_18866/g.39697 Transcript_18866/m.39697 type:complete len:476 (-) Transcript_18866:331-1758(-)
MGCISSKPAFSEESGTEAEYKATYQEQKLLGQGEFGVVKLVSRKDDDNAEPLAVKVLQKGFVFKDNVLYTPMKPEELKMEIDILRALGGQKFNLLLKSTYESGSKIWILTEICSGGEMLEYVGTNMADGLRTEDVSRIAYQLLSAIDHCDRHNVLHRDIKPENIMFKANSKTAEMRLIDFGCATMDSSDERGKEHATFAGTPFYISPEMFQKVYTSKTDVFSAGVVLYVLVAGYPAERLQEAFNLLHKAKRDLKMLPGMPESMPDTYYEMLDQMLVYRFKGRKSAGDLINNEFVTFHQTLGGGAKKPKRGSGMERTKSVLLSGTGEKAAAAFGFVKFQRSLTTILATLLDRPAILSLISFCEAEVSLDKKADDKLGVISVKSIKTILETMKKPECVAAIEKQKNAHAYENFSYEYTLLKAFCSKEEPKEAEYVDRSLKLKRNFQASVRNFNLSASERAPRKSGLTSAKSVRIRGL